MQSNNILKNNKEALLQQMKEKEQRKMNEKMQEMAFANQLKE